MSQIHPLSIIDPSVSIGKDVSIGPWTQIGPGCIIGDGADIASHVNIKKNTHLGQGNVIHSFCSIGGDPQVSQYETESVSSVVIGDRNVFHEYVTVNRGCTVKGSGITTIGSDNLFQASSHVAHDCIVGNHVILGNGSAIAGHVNVNDWAILGAWVGVHQFCEVGAHSFLTHSAMVTQDILPYLIVAGNQARVRGMNVEGLKRRGFVKEQMLAIKNLYKAAFINKMSVADLLDFLRSQVEEGFDIMKPVLTMVERSGRGFLR